MIEMTERAAQHVRDFLDNRGTGEGIRVGIRTAGCSGLAYVLEFVDTPDDNDTRYDSRGVSIFIDRSKKLGLSRWSVDGLRKRRIE